MYQRNTSGLFSGRGISYSVYSTSLTSNTQLDELLSVIRAGGSVTLITAFVCSPDGGQQQRGVSLRNLISEQRCPSFIVRVLVF